MAGINLIRKIRDRRSGAGNAAPKKPGIDLSAIGASLSGGASEMSPADGIRILLFVGAGALAYMSPDFVTNYTQPIEQEKRQQVAQVDQQIAAERRKMDALKGLAAEADAFEKQLQELKRKLAIIEGLGKNRNLAVRMVDFIVSEMPGNAWLTRVTLDTRQDPKVELTGNATTMQVVSEFMKRLEGAVFFPRWQLIDTSKAEGGATAKGPPDAKGFSMNARVVPL